MIRLIQPGEWLEGRRIRLRLVELSDCSERYLAWLEDPEVNRYLETRWTKQSIETIRAFVTSMLESPHSYLFAIVAKDTERHVGNVKLGPIDNYHLYADVSYFIGDRDAWGKGFATDSVVTATRFGFDRCKLHRVQAGFYETNVGSQRVLEKSGFKYEMKNEKKLRQRASDEGGAGNWEDHLWYGALADAWKPEA